MPFPQDRFQRAGVDPEQIAKLAADYEALSAEAQAGYDARIAPISDYQLAVELSQPDAEEVVEEAPEPEVVAPVSTSTSSASKSDSTDTPE